MDEMKIHGHQVKDLASRSMVLLESMYGFRLNETQKYFLGKSIMEQSGKYIELTTKSNRWWEEKESKLNKL